MSLYVVDCIDGGHILDPNVNIDIITYCLKNKIIGIYDVYSLTPNNIENVSIDIYTFPTDIFRSLILIKKQDEFLKARLMF